MRCDRTGGGRVNSRLQRAVHAPARVRPLSRQVVSRLSADKIRRRCLNGDEGGAIVQPPALSHTYPFDHAAVGQARPAPASCTG